MNYALALLYGPGRDDVIAETLEAFERHVYPRPAEYVCVTDGHDGLPPLMYGETVSWHSLSLGVPAKGFCAATGELWKLSRYTRSPYIFWLEDDFRFVRAVDLRDLANVMDREPDLAQMAFMRQPCNEEESRAGSYIAVNPDAYTQKGEASVVPWIEHAHHWTTNPSLIRRSVIAQNAWPQGPQCEGRLKFALHEQNPAAKFGIWGIGDPWVIHGDQRRSGHGY